MSKQLELHSGAPYNKNAQWTETYFLKQKLFLFFFFCARVIYIILFFLFFRKTGSRSHSRAGHLSNQFISQLNLVGKKRVLISPQITHSQRMVYVVITRLQVLTEKSSPFESFLTGSSIIIIIKDARGCQILKLKGSSRSSCTLLKTVSCGPESIKLVFLANSAAANLLCERFLAGNCGAWNLTLHNYDESSTDRTGTLIDTFCPRQRHKIFNLPWKMDLIVVRLQATTHTPPEFTIRWRSQVFRSNNRISDPSPLPSSSAFRGQKIFSSLFSAVACFSVQLLISQFRHNLTSFKRTVIPTKKKNIFFVFIVIFRLFYYKKDFLADS